MDQEIINARTIELERFCRSRQNRKCYPLGFIECPFGDDLPASRPTLVEKSPNQFFPEGPIGVWVPSEIGPNFEKMTDRDGFTWHMPKKTLFN